MDGKKVIVIGSCMIDLICYAEKLPKPGETIHGTNFLIGHGGKGANQCVAAAKLGASTHLIARLGDDSFGQEYKKSLDCLGVNTDYVKLTPSISSGMAQITVSQQGENQIVIVGGANNKLCFEDIVQAEKCISQASVILFQFETPLDLTLQALQYINKHNSKAKTIVNAAPAVSDIDPLIFSLTSIFCVNETEAEEICKVPVKSIDDAKSVIHKLMAMGCNTVIITLGKNGAVFNDVQNSNKIHHVTIDPVVPVDTTGAGDCFLGALAYYLSNHLELSLHEQIARACIVASVSVTTKGTQSSYPARQQLPAQLFN